MTTFAQFIAYLLPRRVCYWVIIRVWADLTVNDFPQKTPDEVTVFDALKKYPA